MNITYRSYLTAGVAALGAGAIALTPVQPIPDHVALAQERAVSNLAVTLASTIDPITPWVDTFKLSASNIKQLFDFYVQKPFPLLQTVGANTVTYFNELTSGNADLIPGQIWGNVQTFFQAPWSAGATNDEGNYVGEYISSVPVTATVPLGIPISQQFAFNLLPTVLGDAYTQLKPIIDFTATHYSGQAIGLIAPLLAPLVQLTRSFTAVGAYFEAGDVIGAINELINIPANVTNAVLNGAGYLDLTGVANAIAPLPPEVKSIGLNLGGLISPGVPSEGTIEAPTAWAGGTAFDSVAANIDYGLPPLGRPVVNVNDPGIPVSWFGSVIGLGQFLGEEMLVTPPATPMAAISPAAAVAPAAVEAAPVEAETPAAIVAEVPAAVEAPAPAVADIQAAVEAPAEAAAEVEAPAVQAVSAPAAKKSAADSDNAGSSRSSHKGSRGKHAG
jgi:hypothetical protein